jgi:exopolyphosphatase/guanosine-5'-triphosphate,3'-diphosphate pyrophosphatase
MGGLRTWRHDMLCACIDIGSNTTRVLVAEVRDGVLTEVLARRAFTRLGRELRAEGVVKPEKVIEIAGVVAEQRALAESIGAKAIAAVATAAIRGASNRAELVEAIRRRAGIEVNVLDGEEEARLAFVGATRTLGEALGGKVGVVDVGGGSTEIAVGTLNGGVEWSTSIRVGSGFLADAYFKQDPPSAGELNAAREHVAGALEGIDVPRPGTAVAVGGSAASLRRLVGPMLAPDAIQRALRTLSSAPAAAVADEHGLDAERVRLLPAGLLVLSECATALGRPLVIGNGGIREGVCLELGGSLGA